MMSISTEKIYIAANNGDIGGGEVMLFAIAEAARSLGREIVVVAPSDPSPVLLEANDRGFETVEIQSNSRFKYLVGLRKWRKSTGNRSLLWCNGLLPATATGGMSHRIVHLHQIPAGKLKIALLFAWLSASVVLVPSTHMKNEIPGTELFPNWSGEVSIVKEIAESSKPAIRVGFIGRFSSDKGLPILIDAMNIASARSRIPLRLVLAGGPKFVGTDEQKRISELIEQARVPVDLLGWVEPEQFFSKIDLVVVPSVWAEPFGLVATESMAARVPLVVSDAGALPEIVGDEYPWISKAGNSESLLEAIVRFTKTTNSEKGLVVQSAFKRWESLYSPAAGRVSVEKILQRFERV